MTLGVFLPAAFAVVALVELLIFSRMRSRLPTRMEAGYEEGETEKRRRAFSIIILAAILTPVLLVVVLHVLAPEVGAIEIF